MHDGRRGYDAIVLAGGTGRRLGGIDKPAVAIGAHSMLERVVAAVDGATRIAVVGPARPLRRDVAWCREDPPGGGPVAAIAAGLPAVEAAVVLVLAADVPHVAPLVPALLAAVPPDGAAFAADAGGRVNYLVGAWRRSALAAALGRLDSAAGTPMRALTTGVASVQVADPAGWAQDCDTWDDVAQARARKDAQ